MKQKGIGMGLMLGVVGLLGLGCGPRQEISPQLKLRDPEVLDKQRASALEQRELAEVNAPLSFEQLGVPTYPQARPIYRERLGSPDADGEFKIVQLATPDTPERVAAFYERELAGEARRQPVAQGNSAMFVWYQGPRAGQTLLIAEDGKGQTLITLARTEMSQGNPLMLDTSTLRPEGETPTDQRER